MVKFLNIDLRPYLKKLGERERYQILTSGLYASECPQSSGHVDSKHRQQKAWLTEQHVVLALRLLLQVTTDVWA